MKRFIFFVFSVFLTFSFAIGQSPFVGLTLENTGTGPLTGETTYRLYAEVTSADVILLAITADQASPLSVNTTTTFYHHTQGSDLQGLINDFFFSFAPNMVYDSWFTLGDAYNSPYDVSQGTWIFGATNFLLGGMLNSDAALARLPTDVLTQPIYNQATGTYRILIGQFTSSGDISGVINLEGNNISQSSPWSADQVAFSSVGINGCTDSLALNYDSNATIDDGSCVYCQTTIIDSISSSIACPGDTLIIYGSNLCTPMKVHLQGWSIPDSLVLFSTSNEVVWILPSDSLVFTGVNLRYIDTNNISSYTNILSLSNGIEGCTDISANNYDSLATCNNGSCVYCTQNQLSVIVGGGTADNDISWNIVEFGGSWASASGSAGNNIACIEDNCYLFNMYDTSGDGWNGATYTITDSLGNVLSTGTLASGNFGYNVFQVGISISCPLPPAENLFFSEYAEGSSDNKYFEIYNPTSAAVDLSNYAFARVSNAPTNIGIYEYWVDFDSGAVILPYDVYIVRESGQSNTIVDSIILAQADMDYPYMSNGDDGFALIYGNNPGTPMTPSTGDYQILDWIGDWNGDPGSGWDVAGVSNATKDHTLVRKCLITQGDTNWTASAGVDSLTSQWIVYPQNYWNDIGQHSICQLIYGCTDLLACNYDSLATINDSSCVFPSISTTIDAACNSYIWPVNGVTYISSVNDTLIGINAAGCIETNILSLTINNSYMDTLYKYICAGDSIVVGPNIYYNVGNYIDSLFSVDGCDSIIYTVLDFHQSPTLFIQTSPDPPEICIGETILLEGSAGFSYYWWDNGSTGSSLIDDPTVDTWYLLSAKDSNDCVVKEDIWVLVDSCITGFNDINNTDILLIYPNPTSNQLTIDFMVKATGIRVYNMLGEIVAKKSIMEGQNRLQLTVKDWKTAIYNIQLYNKDGVITNKVLNVVR